MKKKAIKKIIVVLVVMLCSMFILLSYYNGCKNDEGILGGMGKATGFVNSLLLKRMIISGVITDDHGNPLHNVTVKITKGKIVDMLKMKGKESIETRTVDSNFSIRNTGYHIIYYEFTKDGYYPVKETLYAMVEEDVGHTNVKENIKIIMRETGTFAKNLQKGRMNLVKETQYDKSIRKIGWVYEEKRNLKAGTHDKSNNIVYDDPTEVDIYAEWAEDGNCLYLISNDENTGFTELMEAKDFTYMPEAPDNGYMNKLKIPFLPSSGDNGNQRKSESTFFYFKLKEGVYGKMEIKSFGRDGDYRMACTYYINPDGSRNLRSKEKY